MQSAYNSSKCFPVMLSRTLCSRTKPRTKTWNPRTKTKTYKNSKAKDEAKDFLSMTRPRTRIWNQGQGKKNSKPKPMIWCRFAMQILSGFPTRISFTCAGTGVPVQYNTSYGHTNVSLKWNPIPSNGFSRVQEMCSVSLWFAA